MVIVHINLCISKVIDMIDIIRGDPKKVYWRFINHQQPRIQVRILTIYYWADPIPLIY